ncbi:MAG TPA: hypothetical protein VHO06_17380 [Polyangia bacterium]|nr:hypothetical protein [Polyangia bacterium]
MRVHQAQSPEAPAPGAQAADLRQVDPRGVADEDVLDLAPPVDQDPDLALDLARDAPQEGRPLGRGDLRRLQAPAVDALQRVLLARLVADDVSGDGFQEPEVSTPSSAPAGARRLEDRQAPKVRPEEAPVGAA